MTEPLTHRCCPVCQSEEQTTIFAEADYDLSRLDEYAFASRKLPEYMRYRLIRCPACELVYASPVPAAQSLATAYEEASFDSAEEAGCAARTYGQLLPRILDRIPHRDAALDVGTGDGAFLAELAACGFRRVMGVEPSSAPIAAAKPEVREWIRQGVFREGDFAPDSLSLLTCFQTIEHLPDPAALCRSALRLLQPGGAVLFVGHNYQAMINRLLGLRSPILDIEHLQIFAPAAMKEMLTRCGFVGIEVRSIVNRYPLHYWLKLTPLPRRVKVALTASLKRIGLGHLQIAIPAGNMAAWAFKPAALPSLEQASPQA